MKKPIKKTVCNIIFERKNGEQILSIKTVEEIEKLFTSDEVVRSEIYKDERGVGLEFYKFKSDVYKFLENYNKYKEFKVVLDSYGQAFMEERVVNLSLLRTKGISEGVKVKIDKLIVDNEVKAWIEELAKFIKYLYSNFVVRTVVKASINFVF